MKKESKTTKFAIIVLALTMIAMILVSGTYAKYVASTSASDTAKVATWLVKVNNQDITLANASTKTLNIDLFGTIKDSDGNTETDVTASADGAQRIIAPGTQGEFSLTVANESQVTAKYTINLTLSETSIPLEFSKDGKNWTSDIASLGVSDAQTLAKQTGTSTPLNIK